LSLLTRILVSCPSVLRYDFAMAAKKTGPPPPTTLAGRLDRAGRSELHYQAQKRDLGRAKMMIEQGLDVSLADRDGWTPLHFAAQEYNADFAALLMDSGASVDARNAHGNTPLFVAVFNSQGRGELIRLLRERGADPYSMNNYGVSPLLLARTIGNYDVAQFFRDLPQE
jgi:uncharacterized protein